MNPKFNNQVNRFLYILVCTLFLISNVVSGAIIAVEVFNKTHSFEYYTIVIYTVISSFFYYWLMFRRKKPL